MAIAKTYNPSEIEDKWYQHWLDHKFFKSTPDPSKEPFTIVIPPPNVTGVLHMGHMLNNTIQDVLIRKARMEGKEACWVPGTDHASIATEAKVVAMLKERGIDKKDLTREEFLNYAWEWKDKYGGIILDQLKKLGASADWDRTRFTMEPSMSEAVIDVFIDLYKKGHIYRGVRMVNWDPKGGTALSDEEVIHKEVNSKLYYIEYKVGGEDSFITIATTRPETIFADTAICVHPDDDRYKFLHNKKAIIPLLNKEIPVITDKYISMEFGTGCLKVTPAHDINDYNLGIKHNLPVVDLLNPDGTLNEHGHQYKGMDRFTVRKQIVKDLQEAGNLVKVEDYKSSVGYSERTDAVIEPRLSMQWFLKMKEISGPALENVMNDNIQLYPSKFKNMYRSWMENVHDWCISRQLWWGQQIPAYYLPNGQFVVAKTIEEALNLAKAQDPSLTTQDLRQEEDVVDTWFSSWLWPISVFDGFKNPDNADIKYYYPTNDLVTAPEILFFWVARMIIAGYEYKGEMPFKNVYLTGIVRDKQGRKMSKSLGNSPDPLNLIKTYGADGVRTGMLFSSPAGNDLLFDEKLCEQGRNFNNKLWNAFRLVDGWTVNPALSSGNAEKIAIEWFEAKFNAALTELEDHFSKFRISDALMTVYKLVWDDFCSWYLEMVKPGFEQPIDSNTYQTTIKFFEDLIKILHPFMPFITEEIWHELKERNEKDCIIVASWPEKKEVDQAILKESELIFELIAAIRNTRNNKQISPKVALELNIVAKDASGYKKFEGIIKKLANISQIGFDKSPQDEAPAIIIKGDEIYIPLKEQLNPEKEKENLVKELEYMKGFLLSVEKKLSNEKFITSAPEKVVEGEKQKKADALEKIRAIESALALL
ncbi:MAG TPA: valine--tRNA ligase [Cytophagales bacterium]|nr:valine--tRNA ligase [Cytophagales bacterium]